MYKHINEGPTQVETAHDHATNVPRPTDDWEPISDGSP